MAACGVCILCNEVVSEQDYRREIDCPSKTCPGRWFHEDCIAGYLKRTKYSKDRCTGFPCPAILSTGKQCPGYVCKMHNYFPANQTKKKKKMDAMIAAASAPKPRAPPVAKPKPVSQVAIAAIKGVPQPVSKRIGVQTAIEQRIIPGLNDVNNLQALRARKAEIKAQMKAPGGTNAAASKNVSAGRAAVQAMLGASIGQRPGLVNDFEEADRVPQGATVWDAISKSKGELNLTLTDFDNNRNGGDGKFSMLLRKRLEGNVIVFTDSDSVTYDGSSSECDSIITASSVRDTESSGGISGATSVFQLVPTNNDIDKDSPVFAMTAPAEAIEHAVDQASVDVEGDTEGDPVVEYDMVYGAGDGSYLVLDTVSKSYYRVGDVYGDLAELVEVMGEDGNMYTCVAVRKSQLEAREELQRAWLQAQFSGDSPPEQAAAPSVEHACVPDVSCAMEAVEEEDTDVDSLMQLLCV